MLSNVLQPLELASWIAWPAAGLVLSTAAGERDTGEPREGIGVVGDRFRCASSRSRSSSFSCSCCTCACCSRSRAALNAYNKSYLSTPNHIHVCVLLLVHTHALYSTGPSRIARARARTHTHTHTHTHISQYNFTSDLVK